MVYGYSYMFSTIFTKKNNPCDNLFAFLDHKALPKWGLFLHYLGLSEFFLLRVPPSPCPRSQRNEAKMKMAELLSLKMYSLTVIKLLAVVHSDQTAFHRQYYLDLNCFHRHFHLNIEGSGVWVYLHFSTIFYKGEQLS